MENYLYHHGIKGQRWGIRRYQNEDGSLTPAGREHYGYTGDIKTRKDYKNAIKGAKETFRYNKKFIDANYDGSRADKRSFKKTERQVYKEGLKEIKDEYKKTSDYKIDKAVKIGLAVVGTALVAYGGYKLYKNGAFDRFLSKGKSLVDLELDKNDFSTFKPDSFKPDSFKPDSFKPDSFKPGGIKLDTQKSLGDFKFQRAVRIDASGKASSIDLPVDKEGYADTFAKQMIKNSGNKAADYEYWRNYILNKMK